MKTIDKPFPKKRYLFAYGRYRRVFDPDAEEPSFKRPSDLLDQLASNARIRRTVTLDRPDNNLLRDLPGYLIALDFGRQSDSRLEHVWERLSDSVANLGQDIDGIEMIEGPYGYVPKVVRRGVPLNLRELSDGYQAFLVILFDLVLRYAYLFPSMEDPLAGPALVAVDELGLHLHPRWQRVAADQLVDLFPGTQFVFTTHSPAVVQGAIDRDYLVVTLSEKDGGGVAEHLGSHLMNVLQGAEIGSLLSEKRLFGVESRYSKKYEKVGDRVDEIQKKIARGSATDDDHEELFRELEKLETAVAKGDVRRADSRLMSQLTELRIAMLEDLGNLVAKQRKKS